MFGSLAIGLHSPSNSTRHLQSSAVRGGAGRHEVACVGLALSGVWHGVEGDNSGIPGRSTASQLEEALVALRPALDLAAACITGTDAEGAISGVMKLAEMVLAMKSNKEDLSELGERLKNLRDIDPKAVEPELTERLTMLTSKLSPLADQCDALRGKGGVARFWSSKQHKEKIQGIKDSIPRSETSLHRDGVER
ncbi:hypothetical protein K438DRAFT_1752609 [Mycena galopus ATCC 62051]|nr:hypothetical protein K438DRAFT_1752609 [Mycena galopus ATCC 62051]